MTKWDEVGISVVIKIVDIDVSLSFQRFPKYYKDDHGEHLKIKGEIMYSDVKNHNKGSTINIHAITKFDRPAPDEEDIMTLKYSEREKALDASPLVGWFEGSGLYLDVDDRFLQIFCSTRILNKEAFLFLNCVRMKRQKPNVRSYMLDTEFDIRDYEG